jgi:peptidoglycan/xylan/chitin deacetylase (PgdA/CDA1 family)
MSLFQVLALLFAAKTPSSSTPSSVFNCANNPYPTKYPDVTNNPIPSILTCATPGVFALTFDDGVAPALTPALLSLLASQNVIATFFINGQNYNELCSSVSSNTLGQIYDAGHQIASHSWNHLYMSTLSNLELYAQMRLNDVAINSIIGVAPIYFRFPFLDESDNALSAIASWGYKSVHRNIENRYAN